MLLWPPVLFAVLRKVASRDSLEERGGIHLYALTANSPLQRYDALGEAVVVPVVPVLIVVGGSLAIEVAVRVVCVCRFQRCQEAYVRTPVSILIHFSGVFNAVGQTACNGPYTVRTKLWKDVRGDCHSAYVVLCLSVVSPGGGGLAGPGITGAGF